MHFIYITNDWQEYCNKFFVIVLFASYDKHICAMLFIINCDERQCTLTFNHNQLRLAIVLQQLLCHCAVRIL